MSTSAHAVRARSPVADEPYFRTPDGVYAPTRAIAHRNEEYDEAGFDDLVAMQQHHFWYRGRHRFLLHAVRKFLAQNGTPTPNGIDLGGGCGGWIRYLREHAPKLITNLALGDSSRRALDLAADVIDSDVARYQIDLLNLQWQHRWDAAFLFDVLEHIPQDVAALTQIRDALTPGGYLFVATPALQFFWSYNDELAEHQRRYSRADFARLAELSGLELCYSRYFMFFLSPLLYLSRFQNRDFSRISREEVRRFVSRTHRVPPAPINGLLASAFHLETPLGHALPFPWGTSVLAVFRKR